MECPENILRVSYQSSNGVALNEEMSEHEEHYDPLGSTSTHPSSEMATAGISWHPPGKMKDTHFCSMLSLLMRCCTTTRVRNHDQKSSGSPDSGTAWNSLRSGIFMTCHISYRLLQIFERLDLQRKERMFRAPKRTSLA
ncbi:hypothetical protein TNCV_1577521 [Trichonephila clavipes]|nr:hypothetical protein TNCV_1577521 [Trichonephila clavipes]